MNLALCFPELDAAARDALLARHLRAVGLAALETAAAWTRPRERLSPLAATHGLEHLDAGLAAGRGVLVVSAHFLSMEMGLRLASELRPACAVYRPHNDPAVDRLIRAGRERAAVHLIDRSDLRAMVRALRENRLLWYPPDQDYGPRHSVFAPFFGRPAATITATSRLARLSGAAVVPLYTHWRPGTEGYEIVALPPLADFPSGDDVADATRLNQILEDQIRRDPAQYLWVHRRFKTRPAGAVDPYAAAGAGKPQ